MGGTDVLLRFDQPPQLQRVDALIRYLLRRKALIDGKGIEVQLRAVGAQEVRFGLAAVGLVKNLGTGQEERL